MVQAARANAGPPEANGWIRTTIPIEHVRKAHGDFLALGADVEVLGPPELRELLVGTVRALAELYP
jgi:predicted DNA-binding transcriptional regulator YafY